MSLPCLLFFLVKALSPGVLEEHPGLASGRHSVCPCCRFRALGPAQASRSCRWRWAQLRPSSRLQEFLWVCFLQASAGFGLCLSKLSDRCFSRLSALNQLSEQAGLGSDSSFCLAEYPRG